jgi:deoxyribose-phosphate aldolase
MSDTGFRQEFLSRTDVTFLNLRPSTVGDNPVTVEAASSAALNKGFSNFCTWPHLLSSLNTKLQGLAVVIGFPNGMCTIDDKLNNVARISMLDDKVNEFDIVLNLATNPETMAYELGQLVHELKSYDSDKYVFKFIYEAPIWTREEKVKLFKGVLLSEMVSYPNMMMKTCTGMQGGFTYEDVRLFRDIASFSDGRSMPLKVSGGIRTVADARKLIEEFDATRLGIGFSSAFSILKEIDEEH